MAEQNEGARKQTAERDARQTRARRPDATGIADEAVTSVREGINVTGEVLQRETPNLATAALIGVGVAIVEPELIPGLLIGAGATLAPKLLPAVGTILRPLVKAVVKTGYEITSGVREVAAEVREQMEDMVAEAQAEREERLRRQPESTAEARTGRPGSTQPQTA